jgi:hypothetical protein
VSDGPSNSTVRRRVTMAKTLKPTDVRVEINGQPLTDEHPPGISYIHRYDRHFSFEAADDPDAIGFVTCARYTCLRRHTFRTLPAEIHCPCGAVITAGEFTLTKV